MRYEQDAPGRERVRKRRGHRTACVRHLCGSVRQLLPHRHHIYEIKDRPINYIYLCSYRLLVLIDLRKYF